jgi:hypothetical protein
LNGFPVRIYAEVLGGYKFRWQRGLGTMTAPNPIAVQRCITAQWPVLEIKQMKLILINVI